MAEPRRQLEEARRKLDQVRRQMLRPSPQSLMDTLPNLETAISLLEQAEAGIKARQLGERERGELRASMFSLRREFQKVLALTAQARHFYSFWAQLLSGEENAAVDYTPAGTAPAPGGGLRSRPEAQLVIHG